MLSDIVMPEVCAPGLAERVFAEQPWIRVVYTSGFNGDAVLHAGLLDGGLQKPFASEHVTRSVRELLAGPQRKLGRR